MTKKEILSLIIKDLNDEIKFISKSVKLDASFDSIKNIGEREGLELAKDIVIRAFYETE